ncbi:saccharopine dehydrogenase family protein [Lysobacter humi (ex Lee et al. 2017)]
MPRFRVLLIGAYGQFGRRIAGELARDPDLQLVLAGRDVAKARALAATLGGDVLATAIDVEAAALDTAIAAQSPELVIHAAGPFQQRDYRVAEAALACGAHYVDLADGRAFVHGITALDARARAARRWVVSGASSVPGLSAAVVAALRPRFARLERIESAISPGNRTERGLATTRAILGYVGRPFPALIDGRWRDVHGWQSLRCLHDSATGTRWLARCDVPDLALLPEHVPGLQHCDFRAGLELRRMHLGLWLASWAVRVGRMRALPRWAPALLRLSERWLDAGSDVGLMQVRLDGSDPAGRALSLDWRIVAAEGSGPQIPATAAVVLARKLARGTLPGAGARACLDLFDLDEFMAALAAFPIRTTLREARR